MRKLLIFCFLLICIIVQTTSKRITKTVRLSEFHREGPFIFLTKMYLGTQQAHIDVSYQKEGQISSESFYSDASIGMLDSSRYQQFTKTNICLQKRAKLYRTDGFNFKQERQGMKHIKMFDFTSSKLWYFYVFSCKSDLTEMANNKEEIVITMTILNNGSQFDQNDYMLEAYILMFACWIILIIKFAVPMANILSLSNPNTVKIIVYGGLIFLGTSYLYRMIHLLIFWNDGSGVHLFEVLYLVLKNIGEAIITTMTVAIAWGWSILHIKPSQTYIVIGFVSGLINIISLILSSLAQENQQTYHIYDTIPGIIVLALRIALFCIFILGIFNSYKNSSGKIHHFIKNLAYTGGAYLISWPLTVILVQLFFPTQNHKNIITFVQELIHLCACTLLVHMISSQQSSYRKISLHQDDNPLHIGNYKNR